jgi:effector-binding domain-containing protein
MSYAIHVKEVPAQHVISTRKHVLPVQLERTFADELDGLIGRVSPLGGWPVEAPFAIYYEHMVRSGEVDVEVAVPVGPGLEVRDESGAVRTRDLPAGRVAYTLHAGPHAGIDAAYAELNRWIEKAGVKRAGPPREIHIVGPNQTDRPAECLTEIDIPIE